MTAQALAVLLLTATPAAAGPPAVVVNEVFYNAPDDLDWVQWVELHNPGGQPVAVGGWTLDKGKVLTVPADTTIPAGGYLVFALDPAEFAQVYGGDVRVAGGMNRPLKRNGEKLDLRDASGKLIDTIRYGEAAPWPVSADGHGASLERICPAAPGDSPDNWAASPLPTTPRPGGTPGRANAAYSASLPPVVKPMEEVASVAPNRPFAVSAEVAGADPAKEVVLLYRTVAAGKVGNETSVTMAKGADGKWAASIPGQKAGTLLRYRVRATGDSGSRRHYPAEHDLRPTLSAYVHDKLDPAPIGQGQLLRGTARPPRPGEPRPPRGTATFIRADPKTGAVEVFDYVHAAPRNRRPGDGFVLHFHKDRPYHGQTACSVLNEGRERWLLSEALSFDLYRRAGHAAPLTEFVRLSIDGRPAGQVLLIERPNKGFLRRNGVDAGGNLYKVNWWGGGLEGTHERKTNTRPGGHADLKEVLSLLQKTRGRPDEQWEVIQKHIDVDQMATMFAVSVLLSNWDGYFNNHFVYHDTKHDKWQLYPWDHDQVWGDCMEGDRLLTDMPLMYGMEGVNPGGIGPGWWRPGGVFSKPLLANPHFQKVYLAKVKKLLDETFTSRTLDPVIDGVIGSLADDGAAAAKARGENGAAARDRWTRHAGSFKTFIAKRREFLLAQPQLKP